MSMIGFNDEVSLGLMSLGEIRLDNLKLKFRLNFKVKDDAEPQVTLLLRLNPKRKTIGQFLGFTCLR